MGSRPSAFSLTKPGPLRLYSTSELLNLPAPTWLIDGIMPAGGLVGLYGPPGVGKSFVAIDLAMTVSTGLQWLGTYDVERGPVVYVSAEGGAGIGKRVLAWLHSKSEDPKRANVAWLIESIPINADNEQMAVLLNRIVDEAQVQPALVVVDTLARCFDGNENEQEDMGRFVAGVDILRSELKTTVLVVHHTRLGGDRERGNTAFRGAADTMMKIEADEGSPYFVLQCNKQKDDEEFKEIPLERVKIEGTDSCIVQISSIVSNREGTQKQMLGKLRILGAATWDEWKKASELSDSQFQVGFERLRQERKVGKGVDKLWRVTL
jgi:KaiC/GvpD/RAD55 family RecA-like ATPase